MENQDPRAKATRMVNAKISLTIHLSAYVVVNTVLLVINLIYPTEHFWFQWPLLGWGIGILAHVIVFFARSKGQFIRERMIESEMKKYTVGKP